MLNAGLLSSNLSYIGSISERVSAIGGKQIMKEFVAKPGGTLMPGILTNDGKSLNREIQDERNATQR